MDVIQVLQNNVNVMQKVIKMLGGVRVQESKKAAGSLARCQPPSQTNRSGTAGEMAKIRAAKK